MGIKVIQQEISQLIISDHLLQQTESIDLRPILDARDEGNSDGPFTSGNNPSTNAQDFDPCITADNLCLGYGKRMVLNDIHLRIARKEFISIIGPSGVGKSTLLLALNGSVKIFGGDLKVLNHNLRTVKNGALKEIRSRIGVIYQGYNLVKRLSVLDNIAAGMLGKLNPFSVAVKYYTHDQYEKIYEYMQAVGIEKEALQRCDCLSGGQMQRVAIARALAQKPEIILADEPISSLDPVSAKNVMDTLAYINRQYGITVIANLHQLDYAKNYCSRIIGINKGKILYDGGPEGVEPNLVETIYHDFSSSERANAKEPPSGYLSPEPVYQECPSGNAFSG